MPAKNKIHLFILFSVLVFGFIFLGENINERFWLNDFKVYYLASKAFLAGAPVYNVPFGEDTGIYKYSPVLLLPFSLLTVFPYYVASIIQFILIGVSTVMAALVIQRLAVRLFIAAQKPYALVLSIALVLVMNHLFRELHLGNLNMIIVCLLSSSLLFIIKGRHWISACLLGTCVLMKPYLVVLLVVLFFYRQFKAVTGAGLFALICMLLMALFHGWDQTFQLHRDWFNAMSNHGVFLFSNHTLAGIINYYSGWNPDNISQYLFPMILLAGFAGWFILTKKYREDPVDHRGMIMHFFSLLALLPNLFITDTEHFLFSFPLIIIALNVLFLRGDRLQVLIFSLLVLLYGANSSDFFGHVLSDRFEVMGLLGIGNLGIVIFSNYVFYRSLSMQTKHAENPSLS